MQKKIFCSFAFMAVFFVGSTRASGQDELAGVVASACWQNEARELSDRLADIFKRAIDDLGTAEQQLGIQLSGLREARGLTGPGSIASDDPTDQEAVYTAFSTMVDSQLAKVVQLKEFWSDINLDWAEEQE